MPGFSFSVGGGGFRHRHHHMHGLRRIRPAFPTPSSTSTCIIFPYDKEKRKFITSNYSTMQTQHRASTEDIERFLAEVNEPIAEWYKEYRNAYECRGMYFCLLITLFLLAPLFFCYLCCYIPEWREAKKKKEEAEEKAKLIIREKSTIFHEKGLVWNVPQYFPHWIELWTNTGGFPQMQQPVMQMPGGQGGTQMVVMPQQQPNYTGYQQCQQNGYPMTMQQYSQ